MKFLDQQKIFIKSGNGGNGCVGFRREKYVEFGGPDGGDGGSGGNVIGKCVEGLNTLIDFRYQQHFIASRGQDGMGKNKSGKAGKDIILPLPVGTQIIHEDQKTIIADLTKPGENITLAKGGDGGFGNTHYKSSTNQAPRKADAGWPGEEMWIWLRLKLIGDAGLIGLPNAGKSTFLSAVSRAKPKIAAYPFTTIHPNLGVAEIDGEEIVLADIPGLISGAHTGAGLGIRFLGHIERCHVLLHVIDATEPDPWQNYKTVRSELEQYGAGLESKIEIIALNKCDALDSMTVNKIKKKFISKKLESGIIETSGVTGRGLKALLRRVKEEIKGKLNLEEVI